MTLISAIKENLEAAGVTKDHQYSCITQADITDGKIFRTILVRGRSARRPQKFGLMLEEGARSEGQGRSAQVFKKLARGLFLSPRGCTRTLTYMTNFLPKF